MTIIVIIISDRINNSFIFFQVVFLDNEPSTDIAQSFS